MQLSKNHVQNVTILKCIFIPCNCDLLTKEVRYFMNVPNVRINFRSTIKSSYGKICNNVNHHNKESKQNQGALRYRNENYGQSNVCR